MKIRAVGFEFFMRRQTDRRGGGLCFIICIDCTYNIVMYEYHLVDQRVSMSNY